MARLADFDLDDSSPAVSPHALAANAAEAVMKLATALPSINDVAEVEEGDQSDLSAKEAQQKEQTETVIRTAHATGKAAVWVIGQGIAIMTKGKLYRRTHSTLEDYVAELIPDVVPRQTRRWVTGSKVALAIATRQGEAPVESQVRKLTDLPEEVAVELYVAANDAATAAGQRLTAESLGQLAQAVRGADLPQDGAKARIALREWADALFAPPSEPEPKGFDGDGATSDSTEDEKDGTGVQDAEVVEQPHLDSLGRGLIELKAARKRITKATFEGAQAEGDPEQYAKLLADIRRLLGQMDAVVARAPQLITDGS
ncbi:hypothetical protein [Streptacidiphilus anmyonensis]|uniref:hypothetical protein n=1 Tax=Streptacidiphilus anmyonensis TaxID=405782 RepID=UPI0005AB8F72|nr:hypothetical protein [Streptacidiphilus anmyonensis]